MNFQRYFKPGQKLTLKAINTETPGARTELITVFIKTLESDRLILSMPYDPDAVDQYPFEKKSIFEITTESLGLGLKANGNFTRKIDGNHFELKLDHDLQMFQQRINQRLDCELGIRFSRSAKTLKSMRELWEKNLTILSNPEAPLIFDGFQKARVNISSGGIRLTIKPPVNHGELCLILVNLNDEKAPVCAIAEIVWSNAQENSSMIAGMRFLNILAEDQGRIENFIKDQLQAKKGS